MKTLKITAAMTAFIFLIQTVGFSAPELIQMSLSSKEVSPAQLDIQIPGELGEIQKINLSSEGTGMMVHIQDAHGNYGAQKNIQGILRHLHETYGMRLLLLEGADAKLDPSLFHFFKESRLNEKVADILMKHGEFTGPEMFLLTGNENKAEGHGMEETGLYRRDVELFRQVLRGMENSRVFLESSEGRIQVLESRVFTKDLRDFVKEWKKEQSEERASLLNYIQVLAEEAASRLSLDLKDPVNQDAYPAILRVLMLKDLEARLDVKKIDKEKTALLQDIKGKVSKTLYQALDGMGVSKQENPRFVLEKIHEQVKGLDYKKYPNFSKYAAYLVFQAEIQSEELFKESAALTERIFEALAKTEREKQLIALIKDAVLLEKLFKLELSRDEYRKIAANQESFEPESFLNRVAAMENDKKAGAVSGLPETKALFASGLEFYRLAQERELHFIEKAVQRMKEKNETKAMAVTGGFHAEGFEELVRSKGLSYVLISPRIHDVKNTHEIYRNAMMGSTKISAVTLKEEIKQSAVEQAAKSQVMIATHLEPEAQQAALWGGEETAAREKVTRQVVDEVRLAASLGSKVVTPLIQVDELDWAKSARRVHFAVPKFGAFVSPDEILVITEDGMIGDTYVSRQLLIWVRRPDGSYGRKSGRTILADQEETYDDLRKTHGVDSAIVSVDSAIDTIEDMRIDWAGGLLIVTGQKDSKAIEYKVPLRADVLARLKQAMGASLGEKPDQPITPENADQAFSRVIPVLPPPASAYLEVVEFLAGQLGPIARGLDERQSKAALENALKLYFQGYTQYSLSQFITDMQVDLFPTVVPDASLHTIGEAIVMESQKNANYADALNEYAFRQTSPAPHVYQEPSLEARLAQILKQLQMPSFLEVLGQSLGKKQDQALKPENVDQVFSEMADGRDVTATEPQAPKVQAPASAPAEPEVSLAVRLARATWILPIIAGWFGWSAEPVRRRSRPDNTRRLLLGAEQLAGPNGEGDSRIMLSGVTGLFVDLSPAPALAPIAAQSAEGESSRITSPNGNYALDIHTRPNAVYSNMLETGVVDLRAGDQVASLQGHPIAEGSNGDLVKFTGPDGRFAVFNQLDEVNPGHSYDAYNAGIILDTAGPDLRVTAVTQLDTTRSRNILDRESFHTSADGQSLEFTALGHSGVYRIDSGEIVVSGFTPQNDVVESGLSLTVSSSAPASVTVTNSQNEPVFSQSYLAAGVSIEQASLIGDVAIVDLAPFQGRNQIYVYTNVDHNPSTVPTNTYVLSGREVRSAQIRPDGTLEVQTVIDSKESRTFVLSRDGRGILISEQAQYKPIPSSAMRTASNPNFYYTLHSTAGGKRGLTLYQLKPDGTVESQVLVEAPIVSGIVDVTPDGFPGSPVVIFETGSTETGEGIFTIHAQRTDDPSSSRQFYSDTSQRELTLQAILFENNIITLVSRNAFPSGTILNHRHRVIVEAGALQRGDTSSSIISAGTGFHVDADTSLVIQPEHLGPREGNLFQVYVYDAARGLDQLTLKRVLGFGGDSGGQYTFADAYTLSSGTQIVSIGLDAVQFNRSIIEELTTHRVLYPGVAIKDVAYENGIATYAAIKQDGTKGEVKVNLETFEIFPFLPEGYKRAASNPDFAFREHSENGVITLQLLNLGDGSVQNLAKQRPSPAPGQSSSYFSHTYDVSPDSFPGGPVVVYQSGGTSHRGDFTSTTVQRISSPSQSVTIQRPFTSGPVLDRIAFEGNGQITITQTHSFYYIKSRHTAIVAADNITAAALPSTEIPLELIRQDHNVHVSSETPVVVVSLSRTGNGDRFEIAVFDASRGPRDMRYVRSMDITQDSGADYTFTGTYRTSSGRQIIVVGLDADHANYTLLADAVTGETQKIPSAVVSFLKREGDTAAFQTLNQDGAVRIIAVDLNTLTFQEEQNIVTPNGRFRVSFSAGTLTVSRLKADGTVDPDPRYTQTIQVESEGVSLVTLHVTNENLFYIVDDHGQPKIYTLYLSNVGTVTPNNPSLITLPAGIVARNAASIQFVPNEMNAIVTDAEGFNYQLRLFYRANLVVLGTEKDSPDAKHRVVQDANNPSIFYVINQVTRDYSYNKADVSLLVVKDARPEQGFTITDSGFTIRVNGQDRVIDYSAVPSAALARKDLTSIGLYDYTSAGNVAVNLATVNSDTNLERLLQGTGVDITSLNFPKDGDRNADGGIFAKAVYFYTQSPDGKIAVAYTGEYQDYTTFSTTLRGGYVYTGSQLTSISFAGEIIYRRPGQDEVRYNTGPLLGIGFDSNNRLLFSRAYGTSGVLDSLDAQGRIRITASVSFQLPIAGVDAKTGTAYHGYTGEKARNADYVIAGSRDSVVYVAGTSPAKGILNEVYLPVRYNPPQDATELAVTSARFLNGNVAEITSQNGEKRYLILSAPQAGAYDQRVQVQMVEGAVTPDGSKLVYAKDYFHVTIRDLQTHQEVTVGDVGVYADTFRPIASNLYAVTANTGAYIYAVAPLGPGAQSKTIYIEDESGKRFQPGFVPVSGKFLMDKTVELTLKNGKYAVVHLPSGRVAVYDRPDGNPLDTNRDGVVAPIDVLRGINLMDRVGGSISADHPEYDPLLDVNRDGHISPIDLLRIINELNNRSAAEAEGDPTGIRLIQAEGEAPVVEVSYSSGDKEIFNGNTLEFQQLQRASIPAGHGPGSIRQIGSSYIVSVSGIQLTPFSEVPQIETAVPQGWPSRNFDVTGLDPNVFNVRSPYGTHFETITNGETVTFVDSLARRFRIGTEESENTIPDFLRVNGTVVPLTVTSAGSNPIGWRLFNVSFPVSGLRGDGTDQLQVLAIYNNKLLSTTHYVSGDAQTWALFGATGIRGVHSHVSIERPGTFNVYETGLAADEPILSARYSQDNRSFIITTPTQIVTLDVRTGAKSTASTRQGINLVTAETYKGQWLPYAGTDLHVNEAGNLAIVFPSHTNGGVSNAIQPDISYADAGQIYLRFRGQAPGHFQVLVMSGINLHFREEVDVTGTGWQELRINVPSATGQAGAVTLRTYHYDVALNLELSDFTFVPRSIASPLDPQTSPNGSFEVSFDSLSGSLIAENLVTHTTQAVVVAIGRAHLVGFRPTNAGVYYHGDQRGNLYFQFLAFANFDEAHKVDVVLPANPPVQRYGSSIQFVPGTDEPLIWAQLYNLQRELIRLPVNPATGTAVVVAHPAVRLKENLTAVRPDSTIVVPANSPYVSALTRTVDGDEVVVRAVNGQRILQVTPSGGQTKYFRLTQVADRYEIQLNRQSAGYNLIYPGSVGSVVYVYDSRSNRLFSMDVSPVTFSSLEGADTVDAGSVVLSTTYDTDNTFTILQGDGDQYRVTVSTPQASPNGRYQVSFENGILTAVFPEGQVKDVRVVSGLAGLSGYTVTNKGVYYAGSVRGNPFIQFIPFSNFTSQAITNVRLPRGISLSPGVDVRIVQGAHGIADIRGNDFISRRVNLEKRTVGNLGFKLIGLGEIPTRNQAGVVHQNYDTSLIQRDPLHKNVGLGIVLSQPLTVSRNGIRFHLDVRDDRIGSAIINRMKVRVVDDAGHARTFNLRGLIDAKGDVRIPARLLRSPSWGRGAFRVAKLDILIPEGRDIFKGTLDFSGLSAQSLGEGKTENQVLTYSQVFNRALPDSILNVAHDVTLDIYNLEGATAVVVNYYREQLGLVRAYDAGQVLSEAVQAANEGGLKAQDVLAHLGVIHPATRKPVILFVNEIFGKEDKKLTPEQVSSMAKKIAGGMNEGDLLVGVVAAAENRLMAKLYEEAGKGQFRAKAIPQTLLSDSALDSLTAKMETAPITLSSLTEAGDAGLKMNSMTRIRLNKKALKDAGMNLDWAVGLLEQIADNPEALRKLGLRPDSEGFWEAGSGFVALIEKVYAELKAQNKLAVAA